MSGYQAQTRCKRPVFSPSVICFANANSLIRGRHFFSPLVYPLRNRGRCPWFSLYAKGKSQKAFAFWLFSIKPAVPWGSIITCSMCRWVASSRLRCFQRPHPGRKAGAGGLQFTARVPASLIRNVGPYGSRGPRTPQEKNDSSLRRGEGDYSSSASSSSAKTFSM